MITKELLTPKTIAVIGGSNDITKPGGKVLYNLINGKFCGIYVVNPKEDVIQGIKCHKTVNDLPQTDLAIICIAAKFAEETAEILCRDKGTKAIIIVSAGFREVGHEGRVLEDKIVAICNKYNCALIGPNCIGVLTPAYHGVFAGPIPRLDYKGCDFVTSSGATSCFILDEAILHGLPLASVFSVGNSAQITVEDVLEYWDNSYNPETSADIKLIYMETVSDAQRLLKHSASLIRKGCKIAAVKSGRSEAGSRAASSHTGALAGSDVAIDALFKKAGIIRCEGRFELIAVATVLMNKKLTGDRIAIVTHAGGPAVMLTDTLEANKMQVPKIEGADADELLTKLYPSSSVANPIDFLATGTAEHLDSILTCIDKNFDNIDGTVVIYGTASIIPPTNVFETVFAHSKSDSKPIYHVIPSPYSAADEMKAILAKGHSCFTDEIALGKALAKVYHFQQEHSSQDVVLPKIDVAAVRSVIENADNGYLQPVDVQKLLDIAGIQRAAECVVNTETGVRDALKQIPFPIVMKVVGPVHKSDVGGVRLNISNIDDAVAAYHQIMQIKDATGVLMQPMLSGTELFVGAKSEPGYGHIVLCGLGGIFIEVLKDVQNCLAPVSKNEALSMIHNLNAYKIIQGVRGNAGVNEQMFADVMVHLSALLDAAPEIAEMDINPLLGKEDAVVAVDARIRIEK